MDPTAKLHVPNAIHGFGAGDVNWPGGREVFEWWNTARKDRHFPTRRDFKPASMKSILPSIQLTDVGDTPGNYSVRLVGTRITDALGYDPTGKNLNDLSNTQQVRAVYDWIVDHKKPVMRLNLPIKLAYNEFQTCSVIILPLGPEGEQVRMFLLNFHFGKKTML
ncbi:MAG: PAS domain-containing protein [Kordiimonadaceae bacterium]|nr:PAS domain-containing protein [Kordiimonadaceae bacterium]